MFTASPDDDAFIRAPGERRETTTASPVVTAAARTAISSPSHSAPRCVSRIRSAGANRALGIVLVRDRRAKTAIDRIADELLDGAAEPLDVGLERALVVRTPSAARHVLGVGAVRLG